MKWISIYENLPDEQCRLLLVVDNKTVLASCHPDKAPLFYNLMTFIPIWEGVTHWMYLPDPPNKEDKISHEWQSGYQDALKDIIDYLQAAIAL